MGNDGFAITHLQFPDFTLLFCKASVLIVRGILRCLDSSCFWFENQYRKNHNGWYEDGN